MPDVFISYSRRDKSFVERLNEALAGRGKDAWVDWEDIPASAEWLREIQDGIDASDAFLFVLSPDSVASAVCGQELDHAIERRKRILPIVHRDVDPATVRPEAAAINWVYLRDQDSFEQGLRALVEALDTDLEHVKAHTRLAGEAIDWERSDHDRARLLRGSELQDAERWLTEAAAKQPAPTELQAQFVQASREAARRRGRILFGGVAFALVVAVALAVVALIQRSNAIHQSQVAYSRQLDADAQNQYTNDPELGVLLAMQAARVSASAQTRDGLREAMAQSHIRDRYTDPKGPMGDALWSPDGSRLLLAEEGENRAEIVQPGSTAKPIMLPAPGLNSQIGWDGRGRMAITGGAQTSVWNGQTGALVIRLPTRSLAVALSPDGRTAATADVEGGVHIWNVATGRQRAVARPARPGPTNLLSWSPDGSEVAEANINASLKQLGGHAVPGTLTLFSATGRRLAAVQEPDLIGKTAFSPDSHKIALTVLDSPGTQVFDARTGTRLLALRGPANGVAFSPDGKELAYAQSQGNIAYVYTFKTGKQIPLVGNTGSINSIQFSHTGTYVVTGSDDTTARVFNWFFGKQLEVLYGHEHAVTDATFNLDDSLLVTASRDGTARVWTTPAPHAQAHRLLVTGLSHVTLSPNGSTALAAGPASHSALVLNPRTLVARSTLTPPPGQVFGGSGFSPDGRWIGIFAGQPQSSTSILPVAFHLYEARTARPAATIKPAGSLLQDAVFDKDGHLATVLQDGEVDVWSAATGRPRRIAPAGKPGETIAYSSDGTRLAVSHPDGAIDILNASGGRLRTLHGPRPEAVVPGVSSSTLLIRMAFSPDGRELASIGDGDDAVHLWDLASGHQVKTLPAGQSALVSVAFSHGGGMLAAGDAAYGYVWSLPSGLRLERVTHADPSTWGEPSELNSIGGVHVAFSPDGSTLTTTGDLYTQAWYVPTGQSVFNLPFSLGGQITPDDRRIVANYSGTLGTFNCDLCGGLQQLLVNAQHEVTRGLTPAERARYLRQ